MMRWFELSVSIFDVMEFRDNDKNRQGETLHESYIEYKRRRGLIMDDDNRPLFICKRVYYPMTERVAYKQLQPCR